MKILDLLKILNENDEVVICSDWGSYPNVVPDYKGKVRDIEAKLKDSIFFNVVSSLRIFNKESKNPDEKSFIVQYHIYDSHASPQSNFVPHLELGYVSLLDILLVLDDDTTINGLRRNEFPFNRFLDIVWELSLSTSGLALDFGD